MRFSTGLRVACVVAAAVVMSASELSAKIGENQLLSGELLGAAEDPADLPDASAVLEVTPEMRSFVSEHVNPGATDVFRFRQLIDALIGKNGLDLQYDRVTRSAAETFRARRGNCLSFASMFVALAREADLDAEFEEVEVPPDWSMSDDLFVLNRHVNVRVDLGAAGVNVVDFNISDFKATYEIETISDRRAVAHFFNNLGVERMQDGATVEAVALFRRAVEADDGDFAPAWTNLGMLYRKAGHLEHAEACYLRALRADRRDTVAMSNLVGLYERMGRFDRAAEYRERVRQHRLDNPYYRFRLAQDAFFERDFDGAIEHLEHAIRRQHDEHQFYFLLGLCHLMEGRDGEARRCMARAEELATSAEAKRRYSTKIDALMAASAAAD